MVGALGFGAAFVALGLAVSSFYQVNNLTVEEVTNNYINGSLNTCSPASDGDYFTFNTSGMCVNPVDLQATIDVIESDVQILNQTSSFNYSIPIAEQAQRIDELQADVNASVECCTSTTLEISQLLTDTTTLFFNVTNVEERVTVVESNTTVIVNEVEILQQNVTYITEVVNNVVGNDSAIIARLDALDIDVSNLQFSVSILDYNVADLQYQIDSVADDVNASSLCCQETSPLVEGLRNNVTTLDGRVTSAEDIVILLEGNITSMNEQFTALEEEVVLIGGRVNVTETDIVVINSEISAIETLINTLIGNLSCECPGNYSIVIEQLQTALDSLDIRMTNVEGDIGPLQDADVVIDALLTNAEGNVTLLNSRISIIEGNITALSIQLSNAEDDIIVLQGDVIDLGDGVNVVEFNLSSLNSQLTGVEGDIINLQNDVLDLGDRMTIVEFNISSLSVNLDIVEGDVAVLDARVGVDEDNVTALNNRLNEIVEGEQGGFLPDPGESGNVLTSNGSLWSSQPIPMQLPLIFKRTGTNALTCSSNPSPPPACTCSLGTGTTSSLNVFWTGAGGLSNGVIVASSCGNDAYYVPTLTGYYKITARLALQSTATNQGMFLRIVIGSSTVALTQQIVRSTKISGFYVDWYGFLTPASGAINVRGTSSSDGTYIFTDSSYSQLTIQYLGNW